MTASLESPQYFQAIGIIKGKVFAEGTKYKVKVGDHFYPLSGPKRTLLCLLNKDEMFLRVYPKASFSPGDRDNVILGFQLVAFQEELKEGDRLNVFLIKGVWQFIPQHKRPVISIYRNAKKGDWDNCKATHLPVLWRDAPVDPFRFDPRKSAEEMKTVAKYFCEMEIKFLPHKGFFGFTTLLSEPTTNIPRHTKPIRVNPTNSNEKDKRKCSVETAQKGKPSQR